MCHVMDNCSDGIHYATSNLHHTCSRYYCRTALQIWMVEWAHNNCLLVAMVTAGSHDYQDPEQIKNYTLHQLYIHYHNATFSSQTIIDTSRINFTNNCLNSQN